VLRSTVRTCETGPYYPTGGRNGDPETRWEVLVVVQGAKWRCRDVCTWLGKHHHVALTLLTMAFLLPVQQDWGGYVPPLTVP